MRGSRRGDGAPSTLRPATAAKATFALPPHRSELREPSDVIIGMWADRSSLRQGRRRGRRPGGAPVLSRLVAGPVAEHGVQDFGQAPDQGHHRDLLSTAGGNCHRPVAQVRRPGVPQPQHGHRGLHQQSPHSAGAGLGDATAVLALPRAQFAWNQTQIGLDLVRLANKIAGNLDILRSCVTAGEAPARFASRGRRPLTARPSGGYFCAVAVFVFWMLSATAALQSR